MNKNEAFCVCVAIVAFFMLLFGLAFISKVSNNISEFTEALNQPSISSNLTIKHLIIQQPESDTYLEIEGFEASVNSRLLDILANAISGVGNDW